MKAYFQNLNEREKWMIVLGGLATLFFIFYWFVYSPLQQAIEEKKLQLIDKQETLVWMQDARIHFKVTGHLQSLSNSQLLTLLAQQQQNKTFQGFPYQIQQMGSGDIQLSYEAVPFNAFLMWLKGLGEKYAVSLKQFTAERVETPAGVAKIQVVISAEE